MPSGRPKGSKDTKPRAKRSDGGAPAREKSPITQAQNAVMPEGYNAKLVQFILAITPREPLDHNDVAEMEKRFFRYLELCAEYDMKISNQAAYTAIGITADNVYDWTVRRSTNPERADFLKKVQKICATYRENLMQDGKINPVVGIFWQKNYDGMRDQQEVVLTPSTPLGETTDTKALEEKYVEATYGISGESAESDKIPKIAESAESKPD